MTVTLHSALSLFLLYVWYALYRAQETILFTVNICDNNKSNQIGGIGLRCEGQGLKEIEQRSWDVLLKLYKTLVRPHLKYCVQFWSPYYTKYIIKVDRVQKGFIRMLPRLDGLSYEKRLDRLGLFFSGA